MAISILIAAWVAAATWAAAATTTHRRWVVRLATASLTYTLGGVLLLLCH